MSVRCSLISHALSCSIRLTARPKSCIHPASTVPRSAAALHLDTHLGSRGHASRVRQTSGAGRLHFVTRPLQQLSRRQWYSHTAPVLAITAKHATQSRPFQRKVSHILVAPQDEAVLDEIERRIAGGDQFGELAEQYSRCQGSKSQGGLVGWVSRGDSTPTFEEAVFEADIGELVRVETVNGLHLVRVEAEREQRGIAQMPAAQLAEILQDPAQLSQVQLLDVREAAEHAIVSLPHFELKPFSRADQWIGTVSQELDSQKHTIVMCHHGMRSQRVAQVLESQGFAELSNVAGGIHAYAMDVDHSLSTY